MSSSQKHFTINDMLTSCGRQHIAQPMKRCNHNVPVCMRPIAWSSLETGSMGASPSAAVPVGILGAGMLDRLTSILSVIDHIYT